MSAASNSPVTKTLNMIVPPPVLFNTWKHHAGSLRDWIAQTVDGGEGALAGLAEQMVVMGSELMDLYTGDFTPAELVDQVMKQLRDRGLATLPTYRAWIEGGRGFQLVTLEDGSRWTLRAGVEPDRYVHLHPGRWSPKTCRVRANVLRTAVLVLAYVGIHGGDALDVWLINRVRSQYLGLSPMKRVADNQGLAVVIRTLRAARQSPQHDQGASPPGTMPG